MGDGDYIEFLSKEIKQYKVEAKDAVNGNTRSDNFDETSDGHSSSLREGKNSILPIQMIDYVSGEGLSEQKEITHLNMYTNSDPLYYTKVGSE